MAAKIKKRSLEFHLSPFLLLLWPLTPAGCTAQRWGCHEGQAGRGCREGRQRARGLGAGSGGGWRSGASLQMDPGQHMQKGGAHSPCQQHNLWKNIIRPLIPLTSHWLLLWNCIFPRRRVGVRTQKKRSHLRNQSALICTFNINRKRKGHPPVWSPSS